MASTELFDEEFYQEDFSTASEWEAFVAKIQDSLESFEIEENENPLTKDVLSLCEWTKTSEDIIFNEFDLTLTRYKAKIDVNVDSIAPAKTSYVFSDLMNFENDYCILDDGKHLKDEFVLLNEPKKANIHPIARWYGLRDFVVLAPRKKAINDISQIKLLQSSINLAVFESKCKIPVFIQGLYKEQDVYFGVYEFSEFRSSFDIVHLKQTPLNCKHLTGLLDMFKGKVGVPYMNPVMVSVCLTYSLKDFLEATYVSTKKFEFRDDVDEDDTLSDFKTLPFGVSDDPVHEFILYTKWLNVAENVVYDSQTYTDFNPINAPIWSIRSRFDYSPVCFLSDFIHEYLILSESRENLSEYYSFINVKNRVNSANPLNVLTESNIPRIPSITADIDSQTFIIDGPLSDNLLKKMFSYLFSDEDANSKYPYENNHPEPFDPQRIKSAHADSLVHRLSSLLAMCFAYFSGKKAVAQLWAEFTQKLRQKVDHCSQIPGVAYGFPDSRSCLLHQKLQMLNICMERRNIREGGLPFSMQSSSTSKETLLQQQIEASKGKTDSDDEFFDCDDDKVDDEEENQSRSPWNPVGRLAKLGDMLLMDSDEPLYIPITQDPVPKTEDEIEDDAEMLLKLGPDSEMRNQLMSASLLSDMESFKAANPSAKLEDFIRWYSPRDWVEEDCDERDPFGRKGRLSDRMMIPGNIWQTVWKTAKPVPARRQKRLFDDTKEAEKVLHFFESLTLGQICQLTVTSLFHSAVIRLQDELTDEKDVIPDCQEIQDRLKQVCCQLSREKWNSQNNISKKKWEILANDIGGLELSINQVKSLKIKLFPEKYEHSDDDKKLLISLMKCLDTELSGGAKNDIGVRVMYMFNLEKAAHNEQRVEDLSWTLPDYIEKQFILRLSGNTVNRGPGGPQFMRAILSANEFRLCGAFSQNTTFAFPC